MCPFESGGIHRKQTFAFLLFGIRMLYLYFLCGGGAAAFCCAVVVMLEFSQQEVQLPVWALKCDLCQGCAKVVAG
jgi:hypothetical protein